LHEGFFVLLSDLDGFDNEFGVDLVLFYNLKMLLVNDVLKDEVVSDQNE
jgi:hypothetical protein